MSEAWLFQMLRYLLTDMHNDYLPEHFISFPTCHFNHITDLDRIFRLRKQERIVTITTYHRINVIFNCRPLIKCCPADNFNSFPSCYFNQTINLSKSRLTFVKTKAFRESVANLKFRGAAQLQSKKYYIGYKTCEDLEV